MGLAKVIVLPSLGEKNRVLLHNFFDDRGISVRNGCNVILSFHPLLLFFYFDVGVRFRGKKIGVNNCPFTSLFFCTDFAEERHTMKSLVFWRVRWTVICPSGVIGANVTRRAVPA